MLKNKNKIYSCHVHSICWVKYAADKDKYGAEKKTKKAKKRERQIVANGDRKMLRERRKE